jgi:hypothetical protein
VCWCLNDDGVTGVPLGLGYVALLEVGANGKVARAKIEQHTGLDEADRRCVEDSYLELTLPNDGFGAIRHTVTIGSRMLESDHEGTALALSCPASGTELEMPPMWPIPRRYY